MRIVTGAFGVVCGMVIIAIAARYGFKTSDNDFDGYIWAFMYGAVSFGGLFGHALGVRVWRHSRPAGLKIFAGSAFALTISLSNSLGAMAGRGSETQAKRLQIAETVRNLNRTLDAASREREASLFTPTDAEAVKAAKAKADAATAAKEAECKKRGDRCRDREADERNTLDALEKATLQKTATDRAAVLDALISETKVKIEKAGPVLEANPQGSMFARLFDMPDSKASLLTAWQNFAMAVTVEMLIVLSMIAFEVLGKEKLAPQAAGKRREADLPPAVPLPTEKPQALPTPARPRLVSSQSVPFGNVAAMMAEIMAPGRGKVELAEAFAGYRAECKRQGKAPVAVDTFTDGITRLCRELNIQIEGGADGGVYLKKVKLLNAEVSSA
ncbi:MAG: hypothetical protein WBX25_13995 [Rhodomicrobium sp.]